MIEKVKCTTADFAAENVKNLLALFPEMEGEKGVADRSLRPTGCRFSRVEARFVVA